MILLTPHQTSQRAELQNLPQYSFIINNHGEGEFNALFHEPFT